MRLAVNGQDREVHDTAGLRPLLAVLREELGVTGPKAGCQEGSCGTCTVLVDGQPRRSCLLAVAAAENSAVVTVEGIGDANDPHPVQEAFHEGYAAQCGYCTPGMIIASVALLERSSDPSEDEIVDALEGHVCRCTGYVKILAAIRSAAEQSTCTSKQVSSA